MKAVLFDHDGTLVDSEYSHYRMWVEILRPHGVAFTIDEYVAQHLGVPTPGNAAKIVSDYPSLPLTAADLVRAKQAATRDLLASAAFPLMPGARETLQFLVQRGVKTAIVTGAAAAVVASTLASHGLKDLVAAVVSGHDVRKNKPAPDCYQLAMRKLGVDPPDCLAVEDTESGLAAAVAANITCVAVSSPMTKNHDLGDAAGIFENLTAVREWLSKNFTLGS